MEDIDRHMYVCRRTFATEKDVGNRHENCACVCINITYIGIHAWIFFVYEQIVLPAKLPDSFS